MPAVALREINCVEGEREKGLFLSRNISNKNTYSSLFQFTELTAELLAYKTNELESNKDTYTDYEKTGYLLFHN